MPAFTDNTQRVVQISSASPKVELSDQSFKGEMHYWLKFGDATQPADLGPDSFEHRQSTSNFSECFVGFQGAEDSYYWTVDVLARRGVGLDIVCGDLRQVLPIARAAARAYEESLTK